MIGHRLALVAAAAALLSSSSVLAADDVLTIGFTVSRTGKLNNDSIAQMRGFELWRDELNDKGGISVGGKQYRINFVSYDDESVNASATKICSRSIRPPIAIWPAPSRR
jgi:branched-chain amino acid transport system substrate-binding protein